MPGMISIDNLYPDVDVRDLCRVFGKYGRIVSAKIESFDFRVQGYICYFAATSADIAINEMNEKRILGNPIHVKVVKCEIQEKSYDVPKIDGSKVFVSNLDSSWDECDVMKMFLKFGVIDEVKISETDGKSNGYGFVKFSELTSAKRAIEEMDKKSVNQRNLVVETFIPYEIREELRQSVKFAKDNDVQRNNLHIKNLEINVSEDELKNLFQSFGAIISVKIPLDESGKSKGFGFVCFEKEEDAAEAREKMDNYKYKSKYLKISFNQKKFARRKYLKAIKSDPEVRKFEAGKEVLIK